MPIIPRFSDGERVGLIARPEQIGTVQMHRVGPNNAVEYRVSFGPGDAQWLNEHALAPLEEMPLHWVGRQDLMCNLALVKMRGGFDDVLYSYLASRTIVEPYQFKPAAKFLDSASHRLLIADEVGLGKTIEAGIIYLEMKARNRMKRVLVVCPSRLRQKWISEFRNRFNEQLLDLNRSRFMDFLNEYEEYQDASTLFGVVGMEIIRDHSIRERMEEVGAKFDLVIIDEAHHLRNQSTQMHRMGLVLSNHAEAMLMLSATPINIRQEDIYNLLHVLDGGEFPDMQTMSELFAPVSVINKSMELLGMDIISQQNSMNKLESLSNSPIGKEIVQYPEYEDVIQRLRARVELDRAEFVNMKRRISTLSPLNNHVNRTRKRDVQAGIMRDPHVVIVRLSPKEHELYNGMLHHVRDLYYSTQQTAPPGFALVTRGRQITSCLPAAVEVLLETSLDDDIGYEGGGEEIDEESYASTGGVRGMQDLSQLRKILLDLAKEVGDTDSKMENFLKSLHEIHADDPNAKVLVFSSYKATLGYLHKRLSRESALINGGVHRLDGDVPVNDRPHVIDKFKASDGFSVLLMSEVGAEGLDFQFTDVMINYDLPWNPMRVEQRIGRVDRYGQSSAKVRIYSYVLEDTVEERILWRLYDRIRVFHESIGELEPILGEVIERITRDIFASDLTPDQEEAIGERELNALEIRKADQKELEQMEEELMGQDILFGQERDRRIESGRYLGEEELRAVLEFGLSGYNTRLKDNGDGSFYFESTPVLRRDVADFCERYRAINEIPIPHAVRASLLGSLDERGVRLTFSGELAHQRELCHLINFDHPLTRFAASRIPPEQTGVNNLALVKLVDAGWPDGIYPFFIHRLTVIAADSRSELAVIVLDQNSGNSIDILANKLLADLPRTVDWNSAYPNETLDVWDIYESYANDAFMMERDRVEQGVKERNNRLVNRRQAALSRTHSIKIGRFRQWYDEATDDRIRRMRETQISNAEAEIAGKLAEQERLRAVVVSSEPLLQGIIGVGIPDEE